MAGTTGELNARRAALLLRCQRGREAQRRIEAMRAEHVRSTALAAETATREQLDARLLAEAEQIEAAHEAVRGQTVRLDTLQRLTALEQALHGETVALAATLAHHQQATAEAEHAVAVAMTAAQAEARVTRKRTRLSEAMQDALRHAADAAEEAELDDHVTDNWNASP
jgi:hypothetical protein